MTETSSPKSIPRNVWVSTILITMQSFLQGYIFMALNPALQKDVPGSIYNDISLTVLEVGLATSLVTLGGLTGCLLAMKPAEEWGRRPTLLCNTMVYTLGALLSAISSKTALFIGRFISGVAVGVTSALAPTLLSEISADSYRGTITTIHQVNVTFAILAASLIGYGFVNNVKGGWRYVQAFETIPCVIMLLGFRFVPESPKWLLSVGKTDEAMEALRYLRHEGDDINAEAEAMREDSKSSVQDATVSWKEVMVNKRGVTIACLLMFIQAFTGINSVVFYSTTIFSFAGVKQAILATTLFGTVNFLVTLVACYLIDVYGRKSLLFSGTCVMFVALIALSSALLSETSALQSVIAVAAVLIYVSGFAVGLGAVCWVMMCELVPTRSRSKAMSLFLFINWIGNFFIGLFSLDVIEGLGNANDSMSDDELQAAEKKGVAYMYLIFAFFTLLACIYIYKEVPETKGRKPEDFQNSISKPLVTENEEAVMNPALTDVPTN